MMTDLTTTATFSQKPARFESAPGSESLQSAPRGEVVQDVNSQQQIQKPAKSEVQEAISRLNTEMQQVNRDIYFTTDDDTGIDLIKVIDQKTHEVIRQFPPEDIVAVSKKLDDIRGVLFEVTA